MRSTVEHPCSIDSQGISRQVSGLELELRYSENRTGAVGLLQAVTGLRCDECTRLINLGSGSLKVPAHSSTAG